MMQTVIPRDGFFYPNLTRIKNGFFFPAHHCFYVFIYLNKKLPEVPEHAKMQFHMMALLDVLGKIAWVK